MVVALEVTFKENNTIKKEKKLYILNLLAILFTSE